MSFRSVPLSALVDGTVGFLPLPNGQLCAVTLHTQRFLSAPAIYTLTLVQCYSREACAFAGHNAPIDPSVCTVVEAQADTCLLVP